MKHPALDRIQIPSGLYGISPTIPPKPIDTISTRAVLITHQDTPDSYVNAVLQAVYAPQTRTSYPQLISKQKVGEVSLMHYHQASIDYFTPYASLGILTNFMESIAAAKELLFALIAGGYLLWNLDKSRKKRVLATQVQALKDHLDEFLTQTIEIEEKQMHEQDPQMLKMYLDQVTLIKIKAIRELTHEELRGDRMFSIFLTQCANLTRKIQVKIGPESP